MKTLAACLAVALCSIGFGQSIDEIKGFREFQFGRKPDLNLLARPPKPTGDGANDVVGEVDVSKLEPPTLWGKKIERVTVGYWNDQLYWIQIFLAPLTVKSDATFPSFTESLDALNAAKDAYGEPTTNEGNAAADRLRWEWKGQVKTLSYSASGRLKTADTKVIDFHIAMMSLPIREAKDAALRATAKAESEKRKDGL